MDNSNNSNWPNNQNPVPSNPIPEPLTANPFSEPASYSASQTPIQPIADQTGLNQAPISSQPFEAQTVSAQPPASPADLGSNPAANSTATPADSWNMPQPAQPGSTPISDLSSPAQTVASNINPWGNSPSMPQEAAPSAPEEPAAPTSSLDNPWSAPLQPPAIDSNTTPPTAPMAASSDQTATLEGVPGWLPVGNPGMADSSAGINSAGTAASSSPAPDNMPPPLTPAPSEAESVPTDLSHLITNNTQEVPAADGGTATQGPETLVVPSTDASATIPIETHRGIPKWLIGVGLGLLITVTGASAYFILGIGQTKPAGSVPATQQTSQQTTQQTTRTAIPPVASPVATPASAAQPAASSSANFGQLENSGTTLTGSGTSQQQATSAADLLRRRQ